MSEDIATLFDRTIYVHCSGKDRLKATIHLPGRKRSDPIKRYRRLAGVNTPAQKQAAVAQFRDLMIEQYAPLLCALPKDEYTTISALARGLRAALDRVLALEARLAALEGNAP